MTDQYFVKAGYKANESAKSEPENKALSFWRGRNLSIASKAQRPCYEWAVQVANERGTKKCLDVGCGVALKTSRILTGSIPHVSAIEQPSLVPQLRKAHPEITFYGLDLNTLEGDVPSDRFDIVISFDVIEHLDRPENLLSLLRRLVAPDGIIMISTPERDLLRGRSHSGPPPNGAHVREWNEAEFREFLQHSGLLIDERRIVDAQSLNPLEWIACQMLSRAGMNWVRSTLCIRCHAAPI